MATAKNSGAPFVARQSRAYLRKKNKTVFRAISCITFHSRIHKARDKNGVNMSTYRVPGMAHKVLNNNGGILREDTFVDMLLRIQMYTCGSWSTALGTDDHSKVFVDTDGGNAQNVGQP